MTLDDDHKISFVATSHNSWFHHLRVNTRRNTCGNNMLDNTKKGNLSKSIYTTHDFAHSTGLPKPPGYNLEWSHITSIQVTLVTRPSAKHRIKTSIQSRVESSSQSNSALGTTWHLVRIAW